MNKIAAAIICVGLAAVGVYGEIHQQSEMLVWIGCVFAFFSA